MVPPDSIGPSSPAPALGPSTAPRVRHSAAGGPRPGLSIRCRRANTVDSRRRARDGSPGPVAGSTQTRISLGASAEERAGGLPMPWTRRLIVAALVAAPLTMWPATANAAVQLQGSFSEGCSNRITSGCARRRLRATSAGSSSLPASARPTSPTCWARRSSRPARWAASPSTAPSPSLWSPMAAR